ncbi:THUMP domain-containing protein 3 [Rhinatrema bivittatum]|uniref:THUMP domain-containing protein 3 n=1 Tax=Rhinatrema bivittatum TaxID=194408 RepID=UPI00112B57DB|nr:THUMP domain-containing protein 3 [Rhinatrema bivittatum]XP_029457298.1 THUMP domain-containing protein 3 [Rhinatrema bivittatum]
MSEVQETADTLAEVALTDPGTPAVQSDLVSNPNDATFTIGATVPTGFELTAAEEVKEKLSSSCRISKDRGKIYFDIPMDSLSQVHRLRSVDNLFVVVQAFADYQFKESKDAALEDMQQLAGKLPWEPALHVWKINTSLKKKKTRRKQQNPAKGSRQGAAQGPQQGELGPSNSLEVAPDVQHRNSQEHDGQEATLLLGESSEEKEDNGDIMSSSRKEADEIHDVGTHVLKFRVTCNRAGDKHSFTSNEAARDFGGAVQEHFQWKADMTAFDVEVLLNIHSNELVVAIALTEESLHRRNITHFGPTTLRSTLAYGMLRLCDPQPTDVILDPMCGTGAIPIEGVSEWSQSFFVAGDNNPQAVNRAANNILSLLKKRQSKESSSWGLPIDAVHWDIFNLPLRTGSVDVIVTDMPFGKRIGSKRKNWDLYPACLREMSRVCRPGTGRAVLLTHDKKCFLKALAKTGHLWRKAQTVWVNIGGLHAAVYLLRRTFARATAHEADLASIEHQFPEEERQ